MIQFDIVDGKPAINGTTPENTSKETKGTNELGKDAFLQLLVAQLKYQDPMEPSKNQEFLGELAQFTTVEELQNLSSSMTAAMANGNSLNLVGKNVIVEDGLTEGKESTNKVGGYVEYVQMVEGKAYVSVNGQLYKADDVVTVVDDAYLDAVMNGSVKEEQ